MLRTRLWMGALLIAVVVAVFWIDASAGWFPFLLPCLIAVLAWMACGELLSLLRPLARPLPWVCYLGITGVLVANLPAHWGADLSPSRAEPWAWIAWAFAALVLLAFLAEMATFRDPGRSVLQIALTVWIVAYLGLLPSFLLQLRWPGPAATVARIGTLSVALAVFVPKFCDIGAYFTGRVLGRTPMAPVLSPKKTWEGATGGLIVAIAATIGIDQFGPVLPNIWAEVGFGLTVGAAGIFGDLAESLIKRDCRQKDASQALPGFGGVLDVVDAILFAAPVAYCWLSYNRGIR